MTSSEENEAEMWGKLEQVKELRDKTLLLAKLKTRLQAESEAAEIEESNLQEYRQEMEALLQEKMAHVEELRLIHADINLMEVTIKQAEEERKKALEYARRSYEEFIPVKDQINQLRSLLGVEPADQSEQIDLHLPSEILERRQHHSSWRPPSPENATEAAVAASPVSPILANPVATVPALNAAHPSLMVAMATRPPTTHTSPPQTSPAAAFRQQPPPMKACLSCHQQIHRNAPICPLCKAKSRSRNPKKPKRKADD